MTRTQGIVALLPLVLALGGCSDFEPVRNVAARSMQDSWERQNLEQRAEAIDERVLIATRSGVQQARAYGAEIPEARIPTAPHLADGSFHPMVERHAFNRDGTLRGEGPSMGILLADVERAAAVYRKQLDRRITMVWALLGAVGLLMLLGVAAIVVSLGSTRRRRRREVRANAAPPYNPGIPPSMAWPPGAPVFRLELAPTPVRPPNLR